MYLSRIKLNLNNRRTIQALASPAIFHGAIESALGGVEGAERERHLWRSDSLGKERYLLVLTEEIPNFSSIVQQFSYKGESWETKAYDPFLDQIHDGSVFYFRLRANPTYSRPQEGKRGKVCAHITRERQREWLKRQGEKYGFALNETSYDVTKTEWYQFRKGNTKNKISMLSVTFEGVLKVEDTEKFRKAMVNGIGREKAYGMGLLTCITKNN